MGRSWASRCLIASRPNQRRLHRCECGARDLPRRSKRRDDTRRVEIFPQDGDLPGLGAQIDYVILIVGSPRADNGGLRGELGEDRVFAFHAIDFRNLDLKVTNSDLPSFQPPMAKTLPPTFQTSEPPHWTTWVVEGSEAQKPLYSSNVIHASSRSLRRPVQPRQWQPWPGSSGGRNRR